MPLAAQCPPGKPPVTTDQSQALPRWLECAAIGRGVPRNHRESDVSDRDSCKARIDRPSYSCSLLDLYLCLLRNDKSWGGYGSNRWYVLGSYTTTYGHRIRLWASCALFLPTTRERGPPLLSFSVVGNWCASVTRFPSPTKRKPATVGCDMMRKVPCHL